MGDNQYDESTLSDFEKYYDKSWGRFKNITHPIPGNHESYSGFTGYDQYFGAIAKPNGQRYYSWEMGNWHFIASTPTTSSPTTSSPSRRRSPG